MGEISINLTDFQLLKKLVFWYCFSSLRIGFATIDEKTPNLITSGYSKHITDDGCVFDVQGQLLADTLQYRDRGLFEFSDELMNALKLCF